MNAAYEYKHYTNADFNIGVEKWTNNNNVTQSANQHMHTFNFFIY